MAGSPPALHVICPRAASMSLSEISESAEARAQRQPRIWKFWGTSLWGLVLFAAMFAGQFALVAGFFLAKGPPFNTDSIKAVASAGTVISLSVIMGLPAVLAVLWLATRMARPPLSGYLAPRGPPRGHLLIR